jgi:conjugal transfer/type IV secretion protein DotA/TraY
MNKIFRILLGFLAFSPTFAFAANVFNPVAGDKSMVILASLFGSLGTFGTSGSDPFSAVMTVFNGAVLTVGGILAAYTILAGTLGTAHDGEMLGKKFSSVWIPIRYCIGTALVLPVLPGGYCLMQGLVAWLIVQGIGLADNVWATYASPAGIATSGTVGLQKPEAKNLGYGLFQSLVCLKALEATLKNTEHKILAGNSVFGLTTETGVSKNTIYFGDKNESSNFTKDTCGKVEVSNFQAPTATPGSGAGYIGRLMDASTQLTRMKNITTANWNETKTLITNLSPIASELVQSQKVANPAAIDAQISKYEEAIRVKAAAEVNAMMPFEEISKNATQDGWLMGGAWFMKLTYVSDLISQTMANVPVATPPQTMSNATFGEDYIKLMKPINDTLSKTKSGTGTFGVANEAGASNTSWWSAAKDYVKSGLDPTTLVKKAFSSGTNFMIQDGEHPVMAMKRLGSWILGIAGGAYAACVLAMATIGNAPGLGMALLATLMLFLPPLIIAGFTLSYVLPMMPFFIWLGVVVSWIIHSVEAMIAAPLWAVMHLHPNGDDLTGRGGNGYSLVLSLVLRPVLMIFGLITALTLVVVVGDFLNHVFADVFISAQQDSGFLTWMVGLIAAPLIYAGAMYMIIKKMFSIIHIIPDEILKWFGGGGGQLRGGADAIGGQGTYAAMGQMSQLAGQAGGNLGNNIRQNKQLQESAADKKLQQAESTKMREAQKEEKQQGAEEKSSLAAITKNKSNMDFNKDFGPGAAERKEVKLVLKLDSPITMVLIMLNLVVGLKELLSLKQKWLRLRVIILLIMKAVQQMQQQQFLAK